MIKKLVIFLVFLLTPLSLSALLITEVQVEGDSPNDCYIKIYNPLNNSIDISGYNLRKKTSSGNDSSIRVFPAASVVGGGDYFVWANSRSSGFAELVGADVFSTQSISSNNSIALLDKDRYVVDVIAWGEGEDPYINGSPLGNPEKGQIIKRVKDGEYKKTNDNSVDFILYPPLSSPLEITDYITNYAEKDDINPLFIGIITSLIFTLIVIYISKKWPDTVTQKM